MHRRTVLAILLLFSFCSVPQKPEVCLSPSGNAYTNKFVGLSMQFPKEWQLCDSRRNAPEAFKSQFPAGKTSNDASPLFIGSKANSQSFARCLIEKSSTNLEDYFALLWEANKKTITGVEYTRTTKDRRALQWVYRVATNNFNFLFYETIVQRGPYTIRLGFWTLAALFPKYRGEFQSITENLLLATDSTYQKRWASIDSSFEDVNFSFVPVKKVPEAGTPVKCGDSAHPCIWKVSVDTSFVYLFGSIHFGVAEFYPIPGPVESAFSSSNNLVVELNSTSDTFKTQMRALMKTGMLDKGQTLSSVLSAPVYKKLEKTVNDMGLPMKGFLRFKPWLMTITLSYLQLQSAGYVGDYGIDLHFMQKAAEKNKTILELETPGEQFKLLESFNGENYLAYSLLEGNTMKPQMQQLGQAWLCGNEPELRKILLKDYSSEVNGYKELEANLITNRNVKMAENVERYLKKGGSYFMVVGLAHLISNGSVVDLLRSKGYHVEKM